MLENSNYKDFKPEYIHLAPIDCKSNADEWLLGNSTYELNLRAESNPIEQDIYASVERRASKRGYSTIGWSVKMYLYDGSDRRKEEEVLNVNVRTLKSAKEIICVKLREMVS